MLADKAVHLLAIGEGAARVDNTISVRARQQPTTNLQQSRVCQPLVLCTGAHGMAIDCRRDAVLGISLLVLGAVTAVS